MKMYASYMSVNRYYLLIVLNIATIMKYNSGNDLEAFGEDRQVTGQEIQIEW